MALANEKMMAKNELLDKIDEITLEGAVIVPSTNNMAGWFAMRMQELKDLVQDRVKAREAVPSRCVSVRCDGCQAVFEVDLDFVLDANKKEFHGLNEDKRERAARMKALESAIAKLGSNTPGAGE